MSGTPVDWARVKAIFDGAVLLDAEMRSAHLAGACGADGALLQQVEALLRSHARAGTFLETPAAVLLDRPGGELIGRTLGVYRLVSWIGAGGMGEVYRAHDTRLDRPVAVKLLSSQVATDADRLHRCRT